MGKIFNEVRAEFDVYNAILSSALITDTDHRSVAVNLVHDFRVSDSRERMFRNFCHSGNLKDCLDDYYDSCIKNVMHPDVPDFCRDDYRIVDCSTTSGFCLPGFSRSMKLATVMNLNVLFNPFKEAVNQYSTVGKVPSWLELKTVLETAEDRANNMITALTNFEAFDTWLTSQFHPFDLTRAKRLIGIFFKVLNELLDANKPYKPVFWVTDWDKLKPYIEPNLLNVARWNQSVGVPNKRDAWQIIIQYPTAAVDCLYRPTQLDGGFFPEHFPPPPSCEQFYGGLTMDLIAEDKEFLPEYIHQQMREFKIDYWENSGCLIGRVSEQPYNLQSLRSKHYAKLSNRYIDVPLWMVSPI